LEQARVKRPKLESSPTTNSGHTVLPHCPYHFPSAVSHLTHLPKEVLVLHDLLEEDFCMSALRLVSIDVYHVSIEVELDLAAWLMLPI